MKKVAQWAIFATIVCLGIKGCASGGFISPLILAFMALAAHPSVWLVQPTKISVEEHEKQKKTMRIMAIFLLAIVYWRYPSTVEKKNDYGTSAPKDTSISSQQINSPKVDSAKYYVAVADSLFNKQKFKQAEQSYSSAFRLGEYSDDAIRNRSKCYIKLGNKKGAILDLRRMGNRTQEDDKIYNKLNPIKKRIVGYCSRCCDGTFSPSCATGRGACSHHGGVCEPNAPEYEEYREFGD